MSIAAYLAKLSEGVNSSGILSTSKGGTGSTSGGAFPTIISINYGGDGNDTATDTAGGKTVTITGANFAANARVLVNGIAAPVVSVVSESTITFTTSPMSAGTYVLYVVNPDGSTAIAVPGISYSAVPVWTTAAGTVATVTETLPISASLGVSSNSTLTLSLLSGSLPPGAIFNSNGTISGTSQVTASPTTYTFTLRATDQELQDTDRQFSIVINPEVVVWSNPVDGGTVTAYTGTSNTINLNAVGSAGNSITSYSANNLPSGLTLAGSTITGAANTVGTSSTTITATTANTSRTSQITFNWNVLVGGDVFWKNTSLLLSGTVPADTFITDYSQNNFQPTVFGDTRPSRFNPYQAGYYSTQFNGTTDFLSIANNASFANLNGVDFTVECWANATSTASNACLMACTSNPTASGFSVFILSGNLTVYVNTGATVIGSVAFPVGTWNHVAFVRNGTTCTLYLNGAVVASATANITNPAATQPLVIGGITAATGWNSALYFNGHISNARVVKGTALYTAAFTPATAPLTAVANTQLLTSQSNRFIDVGPNNYAITRNGTPSVQQLNPFGVPTSATVNNLYSTYFDGTGDYLNMPSNAAFAFGTGDYTIEGWFYFTGTVSTYQRPWWFGDDNENLEINASVIRFGGAALTVITGTTAVTNTWYHIAYSRQSGSGRLFINGTQVGVTTASSYSSSARTLTLMATSTGANPSTGYVSNFRVVKGTAVYTANFTPPTANLTAISGTSLLTCQDATIRDNSTNAFAITSFGDARPVAQSPFTQTTTTVSLNNIGSGYFDGTGDYLSLPTSNTALLVGTGDFTLEYWVYKTTNVFAAIASFGGAAGNFRHFLNNNIPNQWEGATQIGSGNSFDLNTWNHIVVQRSGTTLRFYTNGVSSATITSAHNNSTGTLTIGSEGAGTYFAGYISNLRFVKGTALYSANFTPPTQPINSVTNTQLLTLKNVQSTNNSQFIDNTSAGNIVTRFGNTTQGSFSPYGSNWSNYFNGTTDFINSTASSAVQIGTNDYCLEGWAMFTGGAFGTQASFLACFYQDFGGDSGVRIGINSSGYPFTILKNGNAGGQEISVISTTLAIRNQWQHYVAVRTGTTLSLFIDGVKVGTSALAGVIQPTHNVVTLGRYSSNAAGEYWPGYVSNARMCLKTTPYLATAASITVPTAPLTPTAGTVYLSAENSRFIDSGPNALTLTASGTPSTQRFSPFGPVIQTPISHSTYFDGTGDYLTVATTTALGFGTGDYTVEFWIYLTAIPTSGAKSTILDFRASQGATPHTCYIANSAGTLYLGFYNGSSDVTSSSQPLIANTWFHCAYVRSGGVLKIYVNGVQAYSAANTVDYGSTKPVTIGSPVGGGSEFITGSISNLRVVKGTAVYTSAFTPPTAPLTAIAGTSLLTCQSTTHIDNSANAFAITQAGDATPRKFNPLGFTNDQGQAYTPDLYGGSAYFDGTGDYIKTTTNSAFGSSNYTIECWVYHVGTPNPCWLWDGLTDSGTGPQIFTTTSGTTLNFYKNSATQIINAAVTVKLNQWTHYAFCRVGTTTTAYVNGVAVGSGTDDTTSATTIRGGFGARARDGAEANQAYFGDFRIVIGTAVYRSNFVPPTAPLTAIPGTTLLLNMDKSAIIDYTRSVDLETVADVKIVNESSYNGNYYSNYFDGTGDSLQVTGDGTVVNFGTGDFTIETWAYPASLSSAFMLMDTCPGGVVSPTNRIILFINTDGSVYYQTFQGTVNLIISAAGVALANRWSHVALVKSSNQTKLYVNGTQVGSTYADTLNYPAQTNRPILSANGYDGGSYNSTGYLSNYRIVKGTAVYTANFTPPTQPLTAITGTSLLTCQSNRLIDTSANAYTLTKTGDVGVRSLNPFQRNTLTSMSFDGTGDYLHIPQNERLNPGTGQFTIEMWLNPTTSVASAGLYASQSSGADSRLSTQYYNATGIGIARASGWIAYTSTVPATGSWTHIAITRDSSNAIRIFFNGVAQALNGGAGTTITDASGFLTAPMRVGEWGGAVFNGYIEDLRVTKGYARYTANFAVPTAKLTNK